MGLPELRFDGQCNLKFLGGVLEFGLPPQAQPEIVAGSDMLRFLLRHFPVMEFRFAPVLLFNVKMAETAVYFDCVLATFERAFELTHRAVKLSLRSQRHRPA